MIKVMVFSDDEIFDVTNICVGDVRFTTTVDKSPSVLVFRLIKDAMDDYKIVIEEGSLVMLYDDKKGLFKGYVFRRTDLSGDTVEITAYDQLRYFSNRDTFYFSGKTVSEIVKIVCDDYKLKTGDIVRTGYIIPFLVCDKRTVWDIFFEALKLNEEQEGRKLIVFDNFGEIALKDTAELSSDVFFSNADGSMHEYSIKTDIDEKTYNRIKLVKHDRITKEYITQTVLDGDTTDKWGVLQYLDVIEDEMNSAQAMDLAKKLLKEKNRLNRNIIVTDFGNTAIRAGVSMRVKLKNNSLEGMFFVRQCVHIFENEAHTMKIELSDRL